MKNEKGGFVMDEIRTVESALLRVSGMRFRTEYEITREGCETELAQYDVRYRDGADERVRTAGIRMPSSDVAALFNRCGLIAWDGFDGPHPKDVLDGIMFRFSATVDGDRSIRAEGSENFPDGFHAFLRELDALLASSRI